MRTGFIWVLGVWIFAATPLLAQPPSSPGIPVPPTFPDTKSPPGMPSPPNPEFVAPGGQGIQNDAFKFWVRAEYMAWWVKNTPQPISLVTGDPNNPTEELLNSSRDLGTFSGFRIVAATFQPFA